MSRLNASIKLVVLAGDTMLLVLAMAAAVASGMVTSGRILTLDFSDAKRVSLWVLLIALVVALCTLVYGCGGAFNQVVRRGVFHGRRSLCIHQGLLIVVFISCVYLAQLLRLRERSIELVIEDPERFWRYDNFELQLDSFVNVAYFEAICTDEVQDRFTAWLLGWIDDKCPKSMTLGKCALKGDKLMECDTSCSQPIWRSNMCCPSEKMCLNKGRVDACPYNRCRIPILDHLRMLIGPLLKSLRALCIISAIMIVFTCLLICYNPRDAIEIELLKTGVMTDEDVEAIKRLKQDKMFTYERGTNQEIDLDKMHDEKMNFLNRRSNCGQIHPV